MRTIDEISSFLEDILGRSDIKAGDDIFYVHGVEGDDFHEMIEQYATTFNVDMDQYLWYFHTNEEGFGSIGRMFFKPPYLRVSRIPVTAEMLLDFANTGKWQLTYPAHSIPLKRWDIIINRVVFLTLFTLMITSYLLNK